MEHPLTREAMELLTASELGSAALLVIQGDARFPRATLLLELLYVAECPAPPELQVEQVLPPTLVRLLLDAEDATAPPRSRLRVCTAPV